MALLWLAVEKSTTVTHLLQYDTHWYWESVVKPDAFEASFIFPEELISPLK